MVFYLFVFGCVYMSCVCLCVCVCMCACVHVPMCIGVHVTYACGAWELPLGLTCFLCTLLIEAVFHTETRALGLLIWYLSTSSDLYLFLLDSEMTGCYTSLILVGSKVMIRLWPTSLVHTSTFNYKRKADIESLKMPAQ